MQKQTGKTPKDLETPDFPLGMSHIWSAFVFCSSCREPTFSGIGPITLRQIKDYRDLLGVPLSPFDVETILLLDQKFREVYNA